MMEDKLNLHAYSYSKLRFSDFVVFQKRKKIHEKIIRRIVANWFLKKHIESQILNLNLIYTPCPCFMLWNLKLVHVP